MATLVLLVPLERFLVVAAVVVAAAAVFVPVVDHHSVHPIQQQNRCDELFSVDCDFGCDYHHHHHHHQPEFVEERKHS